MNERQFFENAIIQKLSVPQNPLLIKEIQNKTKFIQPHQFMEFIGKLSEKRDFYKPDEKFDAVVQEFKEDLKAELFKEVPAKAKILCQKLEALFQQTDNLFSPNHPTYDKKIVERFEFPSKYFTGSKISQNNFWSDDDVGIVNKIGLRMLHSVHNSSYKHLIDVISEEMKNIIVINNMIGDKKRIMNKVDIKRIGK